MTLKAAILGLAAIAVTIPTMGNADDIDDAISARQGYYKLVGHNAGNLFAIAKGEKPYDAAQAQTFADNLTKLAAMDTATLWPAGSSKADRPGKTRALPVIWETYPAVTEKHTAWKAASDQLAANAGGGLDALRANIGALGASCKGCHETYRAQDF